MHSSWTEENQEDLEQVQKSAFKVIFKHKNQVILLNIIKWSMCNSESEGFKWKKTTNVHQFGNQISKELKYTVQLK